MPPLTSIDYNCIDRAAIKLKYIIECLFLKRQINGWCLVPKDIKQSLLVKEWAVRKLKHIQIASKHEPLSIELLKMFGAHIQYKT